MPELERQAYRGLAVHGIKCPVSRGTLVNAHGDMESLFHGADRSLELNVEAIAGAAHHRKAIRFRESEQGIVIFLAGSESLRKLLHRYIMPVGGTGGVVDFFQEIFQLRLMA